MTVRKGHYEIESDDNIVIFTFFPNNSEKFVKFGITHESVQKLARALLDIEIDAEKVDSDDEDESSVTDFKADFCKVFFDFISSVSYKEFLEIEGYVKQQTSNNVFVRFAGIYNYSKSSDTIKTAVPDIGVFDWKYGFANVSNFRLFSQAGDDTFIEEADCYKGEYNV